MTQSQTLRKLKRAHWRQLERLLKQAFQEGIDEGRERARGTGRRGRTIRGDATVVGLQRIIERHFGLDRYRFELMLVHRGSRKRLPAEARIDRYRAEE